MKKVAFAVFAAFVALFVINPLSNPAQAYPEIQARITSDHEVVYAGAAFTVSATSNVSCAWDLNWDGSTRAVSGTAVSSKFVAPSVSKITKLPLSGVCSYANTSFRSATAATTQPQKLTITVLPRPQTSPGAAALAGTGGPDRMVLISGLLLLIAGATVAMVARRRAEQTEVEAQTV